MGRIALGVVLAAAALFMWGFLFWAVGPFSQAIFSKATGETALAAQMLDALPETGVYLIPGDDSDFEAYTASHLSGPIAMIFFTREGTNPMSPMVFLLGFLHMLASAALVALLLRTALPVLPTYAKRVMFVTLFGLAAAVWTNLGYPIWWHHPPGFHLMMMVYDVVGWALAGAVLAYFVRASAPARAVMA
jgi:hypothetical protein